MKFQNALEELLFLKDLLSKEETEDLRLYNLKMQNTSLAQRQKEGICWYPIQIISERIGLGGRLYIEIEKQARQEKQQHTLQTGNVVNFFGAHQDKELHHTTAIISRIEGSKMTIVLHSDELPDWTDQYKMGIYLAFDGTTYREMHNALDKVMVAKNSSRLGELREILLGYKKAHFETSSHPIVLPYLNTSQNEAVQKILAAQDIAIVHGPPGTGKTTTLVAAIVQSLKTHKQILVCAPSNNAADLLTEKLHLSGVHVTRIGHPSRITETLLDLTLDGKISLHADFKTYKNLLKKAEEIMRMAKKYKRNFGQAQREERKELFAEARKMKNDAVYLEDYMLETVFATTQVFTSTLTGAMHSSIAHKNFSIVFIDEAGQALEPAAWIPILKAQKVVMAGDHQQLPPTIKSLEAGKAGLSKTLFEKAIYRQEAATLLDTQYRMHEQIMMFSNQKFYHHKLKAFHANRFHVLSTDQPPVEFIDTAGCGFEEKKEEESSSLYNPDEAKLLFSHLQRLLSSLQNPTEYSIGIISPYKAQVNYLKENIYKNEFLLSFATQLSINTIDGFQGQERDMMYISMVRSNAAAEIGFLADLRRYNVAITRAKKKLVVIGDSATLASHPFYADFVQYTESIDAYKSAWEWIE